MTDTADYMTIAEAAEHKGVSVSTIYKAKAGGRLQTHKLYGRHLLKRSEVDAWQPAGWGGRRAGAGKGKQAEG